MPKVLRSRRPRPSSSPSNPEQVPSPSSAKKPDKKPKPGPSPSPRKQKKQSKEGTLQMTTHGIPKRLNIKRIYKCPANCKVVCKAQKELNDHVRQKHPNFRFKCRYCTLEYITYNAQFKHEQGHDEKPYLCTICNKTFMYKKHLEEHERVHSRKNLFPCPSRGCKRSYTTKAALNAHTIVHEDKQFKCDTCSKTFNTKPNIQQRIQGKHGEGWGPFVGKSSCGQKKCITMRDLAKPA